MAKIKLRYRKPEPTTMFFNTTLHACFFHMTPRVFSPEFQFAPKCLELPCPYLSRPSDSIPGSVCCIFLIFLVTYSLHGYFLLASSYIVLSQYLSQIEHIATLKSASMAIMSFFPPSVIWNIDTKRVTR